MGTQVSAINGYESFLSDPNIVKPDVAYWVNHVLVTRGFRHCACVNASVEEHSLSKGLNAQNVFLRDHLQPNDTVVCSIGGNDIALAPSATTIAKMAWLTKLASRSGIADGSAAGLGHFFDLFGRQTQTFLEQLVAKTKPRRIIVCMLYYLDENTEAPSWANTALGLLGYNKDPALLQLLIRTIYRHATCTIRIEGVEVVPLPLFEFLNGKDTNDYAQRVEPSPQGGCKIAQAIVDCLGDVPLGSGEARCFNLSDALVDVMIGKHEREHVLGSEEACSSEDDSSE